MVGAIDAVCDVAQRIIGKLKDGAAVGGASLLGAAVGNGAIARRLGIDPAASVTTGATSVTTSWVSCCSASWCERVCCRYRRRCNREVSDVSDLGDTRRKLDVARCGAPLGEMHSGRLPVFRADNIVRFYNSLRSVAVVLALATCVVACGSVRGVLVPNDQTVPGARRVDMLVATTRERTNSAEMFSAPEDRAWRLPA